MSLLFFCRQFQHLSQNSQILDLNLEQLLYPRDLSLMVNSDLSAEIDDKKRVSSRGP